MFPTGAALAQPRDGSAMVKVRKDNLAPLWLLLASTPLHEDHERIRRGLDSIREVNRLDHKKLATRCAALLRELPPDDDLVPLLKARMVRPTRRAQQFAILMVLQWPGSTASEIVPAFQEAHVYVFGKRLSDGTVSNVIKAYRHRHFVRVKEPVMMTPTPHAKRQFRRLLKRV
jgi:hypothetical protein